METIVAGLCYKIFCILSGVVISYMGYRLFVLGIFGGAGDMDAQFRETKLVLKKASPGTFFAVFGALVIGVTVWKGWTIEGGGQGNVMISNPMKSVDPGAMAMAPDPAKSDNLVPMVMSPAPSGPANPPTMMMAPNPNAGGTIDADDPMTALKRVESKLDAQVKRLEEIEQLLKSSRNAPKAEGSASVAPTEARKPE